jgi:ArsR family metal-binding transcriptional regulator
MAPMSDTLPESGSLQQKCKPPARFTENEELLVTKKEGHIINIYAYGYSVQCFLCQLDKTSKQKEDY